jgi:hypothetical protein
MNSTVYHKKTFVLKIPLHPPEAVKKLECAPSPNPLPPGERVIILK